MPALSEVHAVVAGCLVDGRPFIGGWIRVSLGMSRKNPFHSLHGPADGRGLVTVSGEELLRWSAATIDSALMDYANPEGAWTGELAVAPVGLASAATALKAFEQFSHHFWFPEGYRDDLQALIARLEGLPDNSRLGVRIVMVDPPDRFSVTATKQPSEAASA